MLPSGSLDERKWELLGKQGAASDLGLDEQERPIDWDRSCARCAPRGRLERRRARRAQPARAVGAGSGTPYAPLGRPATVVPLVERVAAARVLLRVGSAEPPHIGEADVLAGAGRSRSAARPWTGRALGPPDVSGSIGRGPGRSRRVPTQRGRCARLAAPARAGVNTPPPQRSRARRDLDRARGAPCAGLSAGGRGWEGSAARVPR
jgi:hypothetical protein